MQSFNQRVFAVVRKIPKGRVATYGQIAALIGSPRAAQAVGWALHSLDARPDNSVPWQRVINRLGYISTTCLEHTADEQAFLLQKEGVKVIKQKKMWNVDLEKYLWKP
ncbi:MAG: methylated-DNA--[protein]-cysteine S-methyltransferase [Patescibacteria group bacterium]